MAKLKDVNYSQSGAEDISRQIRQEEESANATNLAPDVASGQTFRIFKLSDTTKNGKYHMEGIDDIWDADKKKMVRIRLLRGVDTIYLDQQKGIDEKYIVSNRRTLTFDRRVLRVPDYDAAAIEKRMIIDAKVIRPELEKLKSEIKLPDVYGFDQLQAESQEELESMQQARQIYEQTLNSEFNNFNGFNVSVKDEDVEIPIAFNVGEDERVRMKETLSDFDSDNYFGERWFNEDGKPKVQQVMSDIYILENFNKIMQKVANEAASQRLVAHIKKSGNITINNSTPQGQPQQNPNALMDSLADWAFRD